MDVRNSSGHLVSLLNSNFDKPRHSIIRTSSLPTSDYSSCDSSPAPSPRTPGLHRSFSFETRHLPSPSALTSPFVGFNPSHQHYKGSVGFPSCPRIMSSSSFSYSGMPNLDQYPLPTGAGMDLLPYQQTAQQPFFAKPDAQQQPQQPPMPMFDQNQAYLAASANAANSVAAANLAVVQAAIADSSANMSPIKGPKKNHYPCPVSKQYDCHEFFTTSGHAARHAKKHTGKKDAICPECNKAFTRKDNMEQHRRTHSNFRAANIKTTASVEEQKARKLKQQQKKVQNQQNQQAQQAQLQAEQQAPQPQMQQQQQQQPPPVPPQAQLQAHHALMPTAADLVLDPQLRESPSIYNNPDDILASMQQQAPYPNMVPRPQLQRTNFTQSLDPSLRTGSGGPTDSPSPLLNLSPELPSPSLAPALDALALAASRQAE